MKKIGLFYAVKAGKTSTIADKIHKEFGEDITVMPIEEAWQKDFETYDNLIIGASTWFDGELPSYWDELLPEVQTLDLKGKKVALFGLGDQTEYPDNFADAMGLLADAFVKAGAELIGFTSTEGYNFNQSLSVREGKFCGLVVDMENQPELTDKRIKSWCGQVKKAFNS